MQKVSCEIGGKTLTLETGKIARQAHGSVLVSFGDTRVLVAAVSAKEPRPGLDFFPLTVEFQERFYAAGRIPGSFPRREGRPTTDATLSARLIDRPIRPLFPEGYRNDTQVVATVLSYDPEADIDIAAAAGASAALHISDIPFNGPTAGMRVGRIDGKYVVNPSRSSIDKGETDMEIFVTGTEKAIMMVEGGAREVPEEEVLQAILLGHKEAQKVIQAIHELRKLAGKPKREFTPVATDTSISAEVEKIAKPILTQALKTQDKQARYGLMDQAKKQVIETLVPASLVDSDPKTAESKSKAAKEALELLKYNLMREMILSEKVRIDGRDMKTIRPIATEVGLLPRAHGSSLFTRGETQVMAAVTLGTAQDDQIVDNLHMNGTNKFMLHYNFPPFSVGETGRYGGQGRREIGHGMLAERAIKAMMPSFEDFPYTVRIVCETFESNGSSSMGSVCSASMALMDAGAKFPKPVAGIAMGLIKEGNRVAILSDILGDEDHLGDMDFKVAGTKEGVTAIQMDIKIEGVNEEIMRTALTQAREGRLHILGEMAKSITAPKNDLSDYAPRITSIMVPVDSIGMVIGPGGKMIKSITAETGCKIEINDDGRVNIASNDSAAVKKAIKMIQDITAEVELGATYKGVIKKVVDFGAFVGILPNQDGLLHVSEIAYERVNNVGDYLKEGEEIEVKVIDIDPSGKVRLSRKVLLTPPEGYVPGESGGGTGGGGRGPRNGDRGPRPPRGGSGGGGGGSIRPRN